METDQQRIPVDIFLADSYQFRELFPFDDKKLLHTNMFELRENPQQSKIIREKYLQFFRSFDVLMPSAIYFMNQISDKIEPGKIVQYPLIIFTTTLQKQGRVATGFRTDSALPNTETTPLDDLAVFMYRGVWAPDQFFSRTAEYEPRVILGEKEKENLVTKVVYDTITSEKRPPFLLFQEPEIYK